MENDKNDCLDELCSLSVDELRDRCARLELDATGEVEVLIQRLQARILHSADQNGGVVAVTNGMQSEAQVTNFGIIDVFESNCPLSTVRMEPVTVDEASYPSILHYLYYQAFSQGMLDIGFTSSVIDDWRAKLFSATNIKALQKHHGKIMRQFEKKKSEEVTPEALTSRFYPLLVKAYEARFHDNEVAKQFLLSSGEDLLVSCDPLDDLLGLGTSWTDLSEYLTKNDSTTEDLLLWLYDAELSPLQLGENLVGMVLMEMRHGMNKKDEDGEDGHKSPALSDIIEEHYSPSSPSSSEASTKDLEGLTKTISEPCVKTLSRKAAVKASLTPSLEERINRIVHDTGADHEQSGQQEQQGVQQAPSSASGLQLESSEAVDATATDNNDKDVASGVPPDGTRTSEELAVDCSKASVNASKESTANSAAFKKLQPLGVSVVYTDLIQNTYPLSPLEQLSITVDNKAYRSIIHFIAQLEVERWPFLYTFVSSGESKPWLGDETVAVVKQISSKVAEGLIAGRITQDEYDDWTKKVLTERLTDVYLAKMIQYRYMKAILLDTKDTYIAFTQKGERTLGIDMEPDSFYLWMVENNYEGNHLRVWLNHPAIGPDELGLNLIGKVLMEIRQALRKVIAESMPAPIAEKIKSYADTEIRDDVKADEYKEQREAYNIVSRRKHPDKISTRPSNDKSGSVLDDVAKVDAVARVAKLVKERDSKKKQLLTDSVPLPPSATEIENMDTSQTDDDDDDDIGNKGEKIERQYRGHSASMENSDGFEKTDNISHAYQHFLEEVSTVTVSSNVPKSVEMDGTNKNTAESLLPPAANGKSSSTDEMEIKEDVSANETKRLHRLQSAVRRGASAKASTSSKNKDDHQQVQPFEESNVDDRKKSVVLTEVQNDNTKVMNGDMTDKRRERLKEKLLRGHKKRERSSNLHNVNGQEQGLTSDAPNEEMVPKVEEDQRTASARLSQTCPSHENHERAAKVPKLPLQLIQREQERIGLNKRNSFDILGARQSDQLIESIDRAEKRVIIRRKHPVENNECLLSPSPSPSPVPSPVSSTEDSNINIDRSERRIVIRKRKAPADSLNNAKTATGDSFRVGTESSGSCREAVVFRSERRIIIRKTVAANSDATVDTRVFVGTDTNRVLSEKQFHERDNRRSSERCDEADEATDMSPSPSWKSESLSTKQFDLDRTDSPVCPPYLGDSENRTSDIIDLKRNMSALERLKSLNFRKASSIGRSGSTTPAPGAKSAIVRENHQDTPDSTRQVSPVESAVDGEPDVTAAVDPGYDKMWSSDIKQEHLQNMTVGEVRNAIAILLHEKDELKSIGEKQADWISSLKNQIAEEKAALSLIKEQIDECDEPASEDDDDEAFHLPFPTNASDADRAYRGIAKQIKERQKEVLGDTSVKQSSGGRRSLQSLRCFINSSLSYNLGLISGLCDLPNCPSLVREADKRNNDLALNLWGHRYDRIDGQKSNVGDVSYRLPLLSAQQCMYLKDRQVDIGRFT